MNGFIIKFLKKSDPEEQSAALRMSLVVIPMFAGEVDNAPLTEWALNIDVSTPVSGKRAFSF